VPALRAKAALSGRRCLPIVLFPGDRPLASLRRALTWARGGTPEEAAAWARAVDEALPPDPARTHERGLAQLLRGLAAGGALPVLLVDQLEEAALLAVDRDETRAFLALIASAACSAQDLGAVVLASARADLLAPLIEHAALALREALHEHGWPIGSIAPERLVRVITEPLRGRRTPIEPGLAETILADVAHEPGSLALVSQVLTTLWSERGRFGGALTKQGYVDAGRVSGALETQAEAALGEARAAATGGASPLHDGGATDARAVERRVDRLFRGLAQTDEGERFTRRRVPLAALASELGTSAEALRALAQPFVARRLVVFAGEAHKETVEVSHERLLDAWTRLRALLASERESLELRREVEHAAAAWEAGGRRSELWSDATSKLRRAEELAAAERLDLAERERAFLRASRAGVRGQKRLERGALAALGVLLLAAAGALGLATRQSRRADGEALNARHAAAAAEASARDARRQEQLATQKANDVLSLSAQKDLDDLVAEAATLWPAHPEMVPRYASWLARANELIEGRPEAPGQKRRPSLAEHEAQLADLRRGARPRSAEEVALPGAAVHERLTFEYDDPEQAWWDRSLSNLVGDLEQLQDPQTGLIHAVLAEPFGWGVTRRYAFAQTIGARSVDGPHAQRLWAAAIESIRTSPRYGGLAIEPQMGLVPIGMDLGSQLWEFAHLQTGEPAVRGADGRLVLTEETGLVFVLIPGGTLWMGAQKSDPHGRNHDPQAGDNEGPVHAVELSPYFLSKYEMTQGQWQRIAATNPSFYQPPGGLAPSLLHPVEQVAWPMCQEVLERLGLSLPSEAQWEYGARGGTTTVWWTGQERESLRGQVNLADQTALQAGATWPDISEWPDLEDGSVVHAAAGRYAANGYGLHEVTGNVFEWCLDGYDPGFYARQLGQDPVSPWPGSAGRVARGGGFNNGASSARAAFRLVSSPEYRDDDLGLRPARALSMARPPLHAPK
jgi:formylglycine-generating enzyme required for sulfatase activity